MHLDLDWISNKGQYLGFGSWKDGWDLSREEKEGQGKREKEVLLGSCDFLSSYPGLVSFRSQLSDVSPNHMTSFWLA